MDDFFHSGNVIIISEILVATIAAGCAFASVFNSSELGRKFRLFMLHTTWWSCTHLMMRTAPDHITAVWATRANAIVFIFLPYAFLRFTYALLPPVTDKDRVFSKRLEYLILFNLLLTFTPLMMKDAVLGYWGWSSRMGYLFPIYIFTMTGTTVVAFKRIFNRYSSLPPSEKNRLQFFLVSLGFLTISTFSNVLLAFGIPFPQGTIGVALGMIMSTYSILMHRVIDLPYFIGKLARRVVQILAAVMVAVAVTYMLDKAGLHDAHLLWKIVPVAAAIIVGVFMIRIRKLRRIDQAVMQYLDPDKAKLYEQLEDVNKRMAESRQPERWLDEIGRALGVGMPIFVPFDERFPNPCPPMDNRHPLRTAFSNKKRAVDIKPIEKSNICPAVDIEKTSHLTDAGLAVPIFFGDKTFGAMVFGAELTQKMYSSNDVRKLVGLAKKMGSRLADESPVEGLARVLSRASGKPVILDEEPFDSIEDLKSSEFFHFYMPQTDKSIEIVFIKNNVETKIC